MADITNLIFQNIIWLLSGLFFYYFLSTLKVFLLIRIQPALYREPPLSKLGLKTFWRMYRTSIFRDPTLHRITCRYLLSQGGKDTWRLVGNKKINLAFNLINAFTDLLKPYLILAISWAILKIIILSRFRYDELQISLGQIQILLKKLKDYPVFEYLNEYKNYYFLAISIITSMLLAINKWEESIGKIKKAVSVSFTVLSILFSLSFFGSDIGHDLHKITKNLKDLDLQVRNIHEQIYKNVAEEVLFNDLSDAVKEDVVNNNNEQSRLDSLCQTANIYFADKVTPNRLIINLNDLKNTYHDQISLDIKDFAPRHSFTFTTLIDKSFQDRSSEPTSDNASDNYWENDQRWNKKTGLAYLQLTQEGIEETSTISPEIDKKIHVIAKEMAETIGEKIIEGIAKTIGLEDLELPKTFVSFLATEKLEEVFIPQIKKCITLLSATRKSLLNIRTWCFKKKGDSSVRLKEIKINHNEAFELAVKDELKSEASTHLDAVVTQKINQVITDAFVKKGMDNEEIEQVKQKSGYKKLLSDAASIYRAEAGINVSSMENYQNLLTKPLSELMLKTALNPVIVIHPFPKEGCPLCAYSGITSIIK